MTTPDTAPLSTSAASFSPRQRWAALAVLSASILIIMMDMTILNIAIPEMAAALSPTSSQQLWIIDIYSLILAGLLVPFAAIADRFGRKRILLVGYALFGGASLLVLFVDSAEAVILVRALLGVGGAMIMPTTISMIRVVFLVPRERATALSIWAAVSGLGTALGPLIGGLLLEHFTWHAAFIINVPLMAIGIIAGALLLPESKVPNPGPWDALATGLALVGMISLVWGIKTFGKEASLLVPEALITFAVGVALLTWFVLRCLRSRYPLLDLRLFRDRPFSAGIIAALGSTFAMVAALLLLAQWMQLVDGASPAEAGVRLLPVALAGVVSSLAAPPLTRLIGSRAVLAGGVGLAGTGMLVIGFQQGTLTMTAVLIAMLLIGAGTGSLAIGSAMIMLGVSEEKAGNAGAIEETSYEFGALLGIAILGSISALMYRVEFEGGRTLELIGAPLAAEAEDSLGAAVAIAAELDLPELAHEAGVAFTHSMQTTGLIGGAIMLLVAACCFFLVPKGTDISQAKH